MANELDPGSMVCVVFRVSGPPVFRCLFCDISRPMFCLWWFRWAVGHNAGHQGDLQNLRDRGLGSDGVFLAMMSRENRVRGTVGNRGNPYTETSRPGRSA